MSNYRTDDITFCSHSKCRRKYCERHPDNRINRDIPYSAADYSNTMFCVKVNKDIGIADFTEIVVFGGDENEKKDSRNSEMAFMRACGFTFAEIGAKYGLSRQRVHKILSKK